MRTRERETFATHILDECGALLTGHFQYTSGRHGDKYLHKDTVYAHPQGLNALCGYIADAFADEDVHTVIGPAMGGIVLSHCTARNITKLTTSMVFATYAEKVSGSNMFVINRGYDMYIREQRVLVVEDVLTTGGSVKSVVCAVREAGGTVVGVGAIWNRGQVTAENVEVPKIVSLVNTPLPSWCAAECHLCKQNIPLDTHVGKGAIAVVA